MTRRTALTLSFLLPAVLLLGACAPAPAPQGSPAPATATVHEPAPAPAASTIQSVPAGARHTLADARFMEHMIHHHAQALEMVQLVPSRTSRTDLRLLAERIAVSQQDEIAQMQRWLRSRGHVAPPVGGAHAHHGTATHEGMPGMASPAEMARLASSRGAAFERMFLELMIRHHEGALVMVKALFSSPGAAQETETFSIASEVDSDQRMEIARMQGLLAGMPSPAGAP